MTTISSGTTRERKSRNVILTVMLLGFALYFFYDGFIGYPRKNVEAARESLDPRPAEVPPIDKAITGTLAELIAPGESVEGLIQRWGQPGWEHGDELRWFGPDGTLRVTRAGTAVGAAGGAAGATVASVEWIAGPHNTVVQIWIGAIMATLGLPMLVNLIRVWRTRIVLDPAGLKIGGRAPIPLETMTGLNADRYAQRGWVTLEYVDGGRPRRVKLDCDVIQEFRPIIERLCALKGWVDPLPPPAKDDDEESA